MIPKVIHYCWFGHGKKNHLIRKCMKTWHEVMPDYMIKEWNEENFDIHINSYVEEAYKAKKFGYVSDFVRLYALYNEGGIYMDTDVEVLKRLDKFLSLEAFSSRESDCGTLTATMGSVKGGQWVKDLMDDYSGRKFIFPDGSYNWKTNVEYTDDLMRRKFGVKKENTKIEIPGYVTIYPMEWFCPKSWGTGCLNLSENTYTIHHFTASYDPPWLTQKKRAIVWTRYHLGVWPTRVLNLVWNNPIKIPMVLLKGIKRLIVKD